MRRFAAKLAEMRGDKIEWAPGEIRGLIHGSLPNKSNSRRLVPIHGRMRSIKAQDALDFLSRFDAAAQIGMHLRGPMEAKRMFLDVTVYYPNFRRDLDIELLCDALQRSGVIANDRYIREKHSLALIDRENPRVEFTLRPIHEASPLFQGTGDGRGKDG